MRLFQWLRLWFYRPPRLYAPCAQCGRLSLKRDMVSNGRLFCDEECMLKNQQELAW